MGRRKNNNNLKSLLIAVIIIILVGILDRTGALEKFNEIKKVNTNAEITTTISENIKIEEDKLNILFLDVGQADSELIILKDKIMLIDAGNRNDGEKIVNLLKELGISKLDYVIGTHVHEDHIGGMSYIVDSFDIDKFYLPYSTKSTANYYEKLLTALMNKNMNIEEACIGDVFDFADAKCEIMSVKNDEPENINESSIVLEMTFGTQKFLFMGDAEQKNEESRNWNDVDVLKVGHHGSNTSSSESFLQQVLPEISIISVGEGNNYELPKDKILESFENIGSTVYRTDKDGTIQVISDGNSNEVIKINISFNGN